MIALFDANKHILVFDLIFCCSAYDLFDGITFTRPTSKEKNLIAEKRKKATELLAQYNAALDEQYKYEEATFLLKSYQTWYEMQTGRNISGQEQPFSWLHDVPEMGKNRAPGRTCSLHLQVEPIAQWSSRLITVKDVAASCGWLLLGCI